jgi:hypothetical protein
MLHAGPAQPAQLAHQIAAAFQKLEDQEPNIQLPVNQNSSIADPHQQTPEPGNNQSLNIESAISQRRCVADYQPTESIVAAELCVRQTHTV